MAPRSNRQETECLRYQIIQFKSRAMVFRKCKTCNSKIIQVALDDEDGDDRFYCEKCKKVISKFNCNFSLNMQVVDLMTNEIFAITAYDDKAENFMGCTANEYVELLKKDNHIGHKIEKLAVGLYIHFEKIKGKKDPNNSIKAAKINLIYPTGKASLIPIYKTFNAPSTPFKLNSEIHL